MLTYYPLWQILIWEDSIIVKPELSFEKLSQVFFSELVLLNLF